MFSFITIEYIGKLIYRHNSVKISKANKILVNQSQSFSLRFKLLMRRIYVIIYNIADEKSDIMLRDLASLIASSVGRKVIFDIPNAAESAGFSPAMLARMDSSKLAALGWTAEYDIKRGIEETLAYLNNR